MLSLIDISLRRLRLGVALLLLLGSGQLLHAQVNAYARVTNVSGQTLSLSDVDESNDSFEDGEEVIIMQMQDDVLGSTTNDASFGDLGSIASAGLWEVRTIDAHSESGGVPSSITLLSSLNNSYNINSNARVQVISFPELGSPDHTTSGNITAKDWNGNTGGVLAFEVPGTLTLLDQLDADGAGFRGGAEDNNDAGNCDVGTFRNSNSNAFAEKAEGIHRVTNSNYEAARGKLLNGGGGGNEHNGGGGGGANFSSGGIGGPGWDCSGDTAGGLGGLELSAHITPDRFFMGGGGGGGEGNNSVSTPGGDGGGIVIVKADELRTTSSCSGVSVTANGESASGAGNDGSGGGGAAGTVHFQVNNWNIDGSCPLTIEANGGDGGDVNDDGYHGAGGGGGQGAVIQSGATPGGNTTVNTQPGDGGENCNGCSTTGSGGGSNGDGVISGGGSPLPISLLFFEAERKHDQVMTRWRTMSEQNNEGFTVQRSRKGEEWERVASVDGAGTSSEPTDYSTWDMTPYEEASYYRLKQSDRDGGFEYYGPVPVEGSAKGSKPFIHPNPVKDEGRVTVESSIKLRKLRVYDGTGRRMNVRTEITGKRGEFYTNGLSPGIYFVEFGGPKETHRRKLIVK